MKKITILALCGLMTLTLGACGGNKQDINKSSTEAAAENAGTASSAVSETVSETEPASESDPLEGTDLDFTSEAGNEGMADADIYVGDWYEKIGQRGFITAHIGSDSLEFQASWPDSADVIYLWEFSGVPNEAGILYYDNAVKTKVSWDENDNETTEIVEENFSGYLYITEDHLIWYEHTEDEYENEFLRESYE